MTGDGLTAIGHLSSAIAFHLSNIYYQPISYICFTLQGLKRIVVLLVEQALVLNTYGLISNYL